VTSLQQQKKQKLEDIKKEDLVLMSQEEDVKAVMGMVCIK
jgi:hypothetical protein